MLMFNGLQPTNSTKLCVNNCYFPIYSRHVYKCLNQVYIQEQQKEYIDKFFCLTFKMKKEIFFWQIYVRSKCIQNHQTKNKIVF